MTIDFVASHGGKASARMWLHQHLVSLTCLPFAYTRVSLEEPGSCITVIGLVAAQDPRTICCKARPRPGTVRPRDLGR